uniref:Uncharacterized protein n=1 Tax=Arundo donax TaxID=35708 RepID=A0A0A8XN97_ARUDO
MGITNKLHITKCMEAIYMYISNSHIYLGSHSSAWHMALSCDTLKTRGMNGFPKKIAHKPLIDCPPSYGNFLPD